MSIVAYAQLTNRREASPAQKSTSTSGPGMQTYIDALAALVPAEVLALHAVIIAATTNTKPGPENAGTVTTILPDAVQSLSYAFWGLIALSIFLYAAPRYFGGKWDSWDWLRVLIPATAFVGWTMLQRATAFDAAFPTISQYPRIVSALFLGPVLGLIAAMLAYAVDAKPPP